MLKKFTQCTIDPNDIIKPGQTTVGKIVAETFFLSMFGRVSNAGKLGNIF